MICFSKKANLVHPFFQVVKYDGQAADQFFDTLTNAVVHPDSVYMYFFMLTLCGSGLIVLKTSGVPGPIPPNIIIIRKNSETCNEMKMFLFI